MSAPKLWEDLYKSDKYCQIGFVIDTTNYVERKLKQVLTRYLGDHTSYRASAVEGILFHSSIISLGTKFKLLRHIAVLEDWPTVPAENFHRLLALRNGFAHSDPINPIKIKPHTTIDGKTEVAEVLDRHYIVESISSSGKYETISHAEALAEFIKHYDVIIDYIYDLLLNQLKRGGSSHSES